MKTIVTFLSNQKLKIKNVHLVTKTVLITGLIFSALISMSTNLPVSTPGNSETEKTIKNYFKFPQILIPHSELKAYESKKVEVLFTTDKYGNVNFALAKTRDNLLKLEVEKQFYKLKLPKLTTDVVHSVVLNFRTM